MKITRSAIASFLLASVLTTTAYAEISFETKPLSRDRNGMEHAAQINALSSKIDGAKWSDGEGLGYVFRMKDNPMRGKDAVEGDKIFYDVKKYAYQTEIRDSEYYARQSERVGYIELYGVQDRSSTFHLKLLDKDTLEVFMKADESREKNRIQLKRVEQFEENNSSKRLKSSRERGSLH